MASMAFLALVACGTPQEQCIARSTKDLRIVDRLIAETQANLDRGYGFINVTRTVPEYVDCTPRPTDTNPDPRRQMCLVDVAKTAREPAVIDLQAEAAKLAGLKAKRAQLATQASAYVAACQRQYPE